MIDYIRLKKVLSREILKSCKADYDEFKLFNLTFKPTTINGKLKYHEAYLKNLRLKIAGDELKIENSLWKYNNGWNDSDFTYIKLDFRFKRSETLSPV